MAIVNDYSRFQRTELVLEDGVEVFSTWTMPPFLSEELPSDQIGSYKVTNAMEGRPDLISNIIYGTPYLDWVLIAFNNARDLNWPKAGVIIKYPSNTAVITEL